jgi:uncharacterized protein with gpF-like domain
MLEQNRVDDAIAFVNSFTIPLGNAVAEAIRNAAGAGVKAMAPKVQNINPEISISFNPLSTRLIQIMTQNRLEFISEFTEEQRQATRYALVQAIEQNMTARQAAARFRDSIGLTARQLQAVDNYRRLLEEGSAEALGRTLADSRFDRTVSNAVSGVKSLTKSQIDRMVERYTERYLVYRSEMIARTESVKAVSQGNDEAIRQVVLQSGLSNSSVTRTWHSIHDSRTRDHHRSLDGKQVGLDEPFIDGLGNRVMYPGDPNAPPITTIQCRCVVTHSIGA